MSESLPADTLDAIDARIRAIEADPKLYEPYDLNGDGVLGDDEREHLRAFLIAEHRTKTQEPPPTDDVLHVVADRYDVKKSIGHGGQAKTFLAVDRQTGDDVVVKQLHLVHMENWKAIDLFEREGKVLQQLDHPAIPSYVDAFHERSEESDRFYIVQQYMEGQTLAQLIEEGRRFSEHEVREMLTSTLNILTYLHALNPPIIHRDIKPSNIIQRDDGSWALIDFGAIQAVLSSASMVGSTIVGTSGYMAPEQFMGRSVPATDLYALGATAIHMLSHVHPSEMPLSHMRLQYHDRVRINSSFLAFLDRMIEPTTEQRFDLAQEALEALARVDQPMVQAAPPEPAPKDDTNTNGALIMSTFSILLIGSIACFYSLIPSEKHSQTPQPKIVVPDVVQTKATPPKPEKEPKPTNTVTTLPLDQRDHTFKIPALPKNIDYGKLAYHPKREYDALKRLQGMSIITMPGAFGNQTPFIIKRVTGHVSYDNSITIGMVLKSRSKKAIKKIMVNVFALDKQGKVLASSNEPAMIHATYKPTIVNGDLFRTNIKSIVPPQTSYLALVGQTLELGESPKMVKKRELPLIWDAKQPNNTSVRIDSRSEFLEKTFSNMASHELAVVVKNTGTTHISTLKLEKRYLDKEGNLISKNETYVVGGYDAPLAPGEETLMGLTTRLHKPGYSFVIRVTQVDTTKVLNVMKQ